MSASTASGGKHAGQPLPDELPVDLRDLTETSETASQTGAPKRLRTSYVKGGLAVAMDVFLN